jgi:hypothetical protein
LIIRQLTCRVLFSIENATYPGAYNAGPGVKATASPHLRLLADRGLIHADGRLITMNERREVQERGSVCVEHDRIVAVGSRQQLQQQYPGAEERGWADETRRNGFSQVPSLAAIKTAGTSTTLRSVEEHFPKGRKRS